MILFVSEFSLEASNISALLCVLCVKKDKMKKAGDAAPEKRGIPAFEILLNYSLLFQGSQIRTASIGCDQNEEEERLRFQTAVPSGPLMEAAF